MRALTVQPGTPGSVAVTEVPDPVPGPEALMVDGLAIGVCGTDREIIAGEYGWAPPGRERLVLGHESLGRVREAPSGSGFGPGDLVVGVVRRPDPVPCGACAHGRFDMCRNGQYTERGIKQLDGFASEQWCIAAEYAVRLDPGLVEVGVLVEPTSIVAKAWDGIERIGGRAWFEPRTVLVTGAGPIGLLAAMLGTQRDLDVHVLDRVDSGPKPRLVADLGATYHCDGLEAAVGVMGEPDIIIEATGVATLVVGAMTHTSSSGVVCLTGVSRRGAGSISTSAASTVTSSWRTTWCSGRSTRAWSTTSRPPPRSPRLTTTGWPAWCHAGCRSPTSGTPSRSGATT